MKHLGALGEMKRGEKRILDTYDDKDAADKAALLFAAHVRRAQLEQQYGIGVTRHRYGTGWWQWAVTVHRYTVDMEMKVLESMAASR